MFVQDDDATEGWNDQAHLWQDKSRWQIVEINWKEVTAVRQAEENSGQNVSERILADDDPVLAEIPIR